MPRTVIFQTSPKGAVFPPRPEPFSRAYCFVRRRRGIPPFFSGGFFIVDILLSLSFIKALSLSSKLSPLETGAARLGAPAETGCGAVLCG